jgi:hypothetical protein
MIYSGGTPAADEIEVVLFGRGYGEALALHVGDGVWLLVDSCLDPDSKTSASGVYLDQIAVAPSQVHTIVASHWHDDHVRGISKLAQKYPDAEFVISGIFNEKEASAFLSAFSGGSSAGLGRGTNELFSAVQQRRFVSPALHKTIVLQETLSGRDVLVTALSPMPAAFSQSVAHLATYLPHRNKTINHAPPETAQNIESVALHIDFGNDAILLGADLENHSTCGWAAVVADQWSGRRRPATAYKVAHHGSYTGDCPSIWATLLTPKPTALLTPFTLANQRLPTDADKVRLRRMAGDAYISSGASRRPDIDSGQLKRLADICRNVRLVEIGFGAVRLRKKYGAASWNVDLFGAAQEL